MYRHSIFDKLLKTRLSLGKHARHFVLRFGLVTSAWAVYKRFLLRQSYRQRRESYHQAARSKGLSYSVENTQTLLQNKLAADGIVINKQQLGDIHTFAFIPRIGWHNALYPDLTELGPVSEYDYYAQGYSPECFRRNSKDSRLKREQMNTEALERIKQVHRDNPIDWVFIYASGLEISPAFVREIRNRLRVPVVNMCLDDKQSWIGPPTGNYRMGQVDLASEFDLSWTSARVATEWYLVEGGRPLYLPEGFEMHSFHPIERAKDIEVSFIGDAYGFRRTLVNRLRKLGIKVEVFGNGWGTRPVFGTEQVEIYNRSIVNLGMGGIGYSEELTNVKTRDFEIPGTGGGVYLTSYNADLAQHFVIGEEILCYRGFDELVEQIRFCLANPDCCTVVANKARQRCIKEHRWLHRYQHICQLLGVYSDNESTL